MAQDFLPYDIYPGQDLDATKVQKNFEAIEAKFPLRGKDIAEVFGNVINYAGVTIPTDAINVDELFNSATGIARALGCMDIIKGMRLLWDSPTTFRVDVGSVLHRAEFKSFEQDAGVETCRGPASCFGDAITPGDVLIPGECEPVEMNPSGLDFGDGTLWYYVYAKLDIAGSAPEIRVSGLPPVWCEAKGPEHPNNNKLRYIGGLKTIANGELKQWIPYSNGWTMWLDDSGYQAGTSRAPAGNFVRLGQNEAAALRVDIPVTADAVRVAAWNTYQIGANDGKLRIRPVQAGSTAAPPECYTIGGQTDEYLNIGELECLACAALATPVAPELGIACLCAFADDDNNDADIVVDIPVNMCDLGGPEMQAIQYWRPSAGGDLRIDVTAYHEPCIA